MGRKLQCLSRRDFCFFGGGSTEQLSNQRGDKLSVPRKVSYSFPALRNLLSHVSPRKRQYQLWKLSPAREAQQALTQGGSSSDAITFYIWGAKDQGKKLPHTITYDKLTTELKMPITPKKLCCQADSTRTHKGDVHVQAISCHVMTLILAGEGQGKQLSLSNEFPGMLVNRLGELSRAGAQHFPIQRDLSPQLDHHTYSRNMNFSLRACSEQETRISQDSDLQRTLSCSESESEWQRPVAKAEWQEAKERSWASEPAEAVC